MTTIFVNMLAFATLLSSVFSITSKNPVISVIFLISTFVSGAVYLILIGINFVGISYIIVYVGAIAVLFLFVIMMINIKLTDILETGSQYTKNLPLAIAIGSLFIFIIFSIIPFNFNNVPAISIFLDKITYLNTILSGSSNSSLAAAAAAASSYVVSMDLINSIVTNNNLAPIFTSQSSDVIITDFQQIESLGYSLYTYGAVLLITLSVILLLAMFATIVISKNNNTEDTLELNNRPQIQIKKAKLLTSNTSSQASTNIIDNSTASYTNKASPAKLLAPVLTPKAPTLEKPGLNFYNSIKLGIKEAWLTPTYPDHIILLNNNIYIRVFKFIGAISTVVFTTLTKIECDIYYILYYIFGLISMLYLSYRLVLAFYAIKQSLYNLITGKFIVRNSPLNYTATILKFIANAAKNTTQMTISTGMAFTLGYEIDTILEKNGYESYIIPGVITAIKKAGLEKIVIEGADAMGIKQKPVGLPTSTDPDTALTSNSAKILKNLTEEEKKEMESKTGVKYDSLVEAVDYINNKDTKKSAVSKSIVELFNKENPFEGESKNKK
uniref:NADH dehydrogenase subunit 6 n=1 Tax=Macrolepiota fuliginosa TaxID=201230 RepID=A0A5Q0N2K8_9AGAR|nr:NADH dehydrogenase subunit 6 [Macrolepiota fuliginosa]QFZ98743.1 NADH dehydrogenase subunit 6 [Macrolepiota fuliginosa]